MCLIRHEEADFRFSRHYHRMAELAATNFPPEHWTRERITRVFQVYGQVCVVDPDCIHNVDGANSDSIADITDYSAVRVLVLLDDEREVLPHLVVRNLG